MIAVSATIAHAADRLPSWNDGAAKRSIVAFVEAVTKAGGPSFVPPAERIATFDNDGTLWAEQPLYFQLAFAIDRVKALAPQHPDWKTRSPSRRCCAEISRAFAAQGEKGAAALVAATHAGMTTDEFTKSVLDWIAAARHPTTKRPYTDMVYEPMLELLAYLRANGFKTFIVSGGGIEFMRPWVEKVYGIPPEQVVGSYGKLQVGDAGRPARAAEAAGHQPHRRGPGKPVGIQTLIGRRPIAAFGNSDGDLQMLQWTAAGSGARFCLYRPPHRRRARVGVRSHV